MNTDLLFQGSLYVVGDDLVVVEAINGGRFGLSVVCGNYPIDYWTKYERIFSDEEVALQMADDLCEGRIAARDVLSEL